MIQNPLAAGAGQAKAGESSSPCSSPCLMNCKLFEPPGKEGKSEVVETRREGTLPSETLDQLQTSLETMALSPFGHLWCLQSLGPIRSPVAPSENLLLEYLPWSSDLVSLPSPMLTEPCAAVSMGSDVRDLALLAPAPPLSSIPGAAGGCGMSLSSSQWTQFHPGSPYSSLPSHHSLIKQEPGWGSTDLAEDPHCGLGAFTLHFSGQFTGPGSCRVGALGESPVGQPRVYPGTTYLSGCMDRPPTPRNQSKPLQNTHWRAPSGKDSKFESRLVPLFTSCSVTWAFIRGMLTVPRRDAKCCLWSVCPLSGTGLDSSLGKLRQRSGTNEQAGKTSAWLSAVDGKATFFCICFYLKSNVLSKYIL